MLGCGKFTRSFRSNDDRLIDKALILHVSNMQGTSKMDPESRALQAQLPDITSVLSGIDLQTIGNRLVSDNFLGPGALSSILDTLGISNSQKASKIMNIVITQVKLNTSKFPAFLKILSTDETCSILVTKIKESYSKLIYIFAQIF